MSLFAASEAENRRAAQPLAARMRPRTLEDFVGQRHFLGEGKLLRRLIKADRLTALLFYGPPGTGKTTLAHLLARETRARFRQLNAVTSGVKELRAVLDEARDALAADGTRTLLFIDEIHRFNKAQQDALLPDVEEGAVVLVGATTANPFFAVNDALVSRSRVFEFQPLAVDEVAGLLRRAMADKEHGLGQIPIAADDAALDFLAEACDGDARQALSALEIGVLSSDERPVRFTRELAAESVQRKAIQYDADGDAHYDSASRSSRAFGAAIPTPACTGWRGCSKAARTCDSSPGGSSFSPARTSATPIRTPCRWRLRRCRRASSSACRSASLRWRSAWRTWRAPKSNAATVAIGEARDDVRQRRIVPVPVHLRDSHYGGAKRLGHGAGYEYAHDAEGGVAAQDYLGVEREYYRPVERGFEAELADRLEVIRSKLRGEPT